MFIKLIIKFKKEMKRVGFFCNILKFADMLKIFKVLVE